MIPENLDLLAELPTLRQGLIALPLAAVLGATLAFRFRRRGTPQRNPAVIETQILLAVVGAVIMLIVGASLARAFGIAGAASLIRYRSNIADPKDAVVMLSALTVGLASGVGLYMLAIFATGFLLLILWLVESLEPAPFNLFMLKVSTEAAATLRPKVEQVLLNNKAKFELRGSSDDSLTYEVSLPVSKNIGRLSTALMAVDPSDKTAVEWTDKKAKK